MFSEARRRFKAAANAEYRSYLVGLVGDFQTNSKRLWSFLKSLKSSRHCVVSSLQDGAVEQLLLELSPHKACGPDGLSARITRECARELAVPIEILCRMSIEQGVFPDAWKHANVVPVHKKGNKCSPTTNARCRCCHYAPKSWKGSSMTRCYLTVCLVFLTVSTAS